MSWYSKASRPSPSILSSPLYHATASTKTGELILQEGVVKTRNSMGETSGRGFLSPVTGMTYSSPSLKNAAIYALGGVMMGHDYDWQSRTEPSTQGRYGYVFQIDPLHLSDVQPDEDSVGELIGAGLSKGVSIGGTYPGQPKGAAPWWLLELAKRFVAPSRLQKAIEGEYAYYASIDKQLLPRMTDSQKLQLIDEYGAHVAHKGNLRISRAWRLDKSRSKEISPDGSNLFSIAEELTIKPIQTSTGKENMSFCRTAQEDEDILNEAIREILNLGPAPGSTQTAEEFVKGRWAGHWARLLKLKKDNPSGWNQDRLLDAARDFAIDVLEAHPDTTAMSPGAMSATADHLAFRLLKEIGRPYK